MFRFSDRHQLLGKTSSMELHQVKYLKISVAVVMHHCMSSTCRRQFLMKHFNAVSNVNCDGDCDNCANPTSSLKDYTGEAILLCKCIEEMLMLEQHVAAKQLALTFKWSKSKHDMERKGFNNVAHCGAGQNVFKTDADSVTFGPHLIIRDVLIENSRPVNGRHTTHITLGSKASELQDGVLGIWINI